MERNILFIGNFLSKVQGTISPTELIAKRYISEGKHVKIASSFRNKVLRLSDMCIKCLFCNYDIISINVYSTTALIFASITSTIARFRSKDIILVLRGGGLVEMYESKKKAIDKMFNKATHIVTPSHFLLNFFSEKGYNIDYIPNTIDLELFKFKKERPKKHSILWVRAFTEIYNPDVAVRAFKSIHDRYPDATMTMVGPDKGNLNTIKNLINTLGLDDSIILTGKIDNAKLPQYYQSHDVYLNTTSLESFGVAILEAAACGIPVVSTSVGEIPLIWTDEENILLAKNINSKELATSVIRLFEDQNLYDKIQINAFENSKQFSWTNVSKKWDNLMRKI